MFLKTLQFHLKPSILKMGRSTGWIMDSLMDVIQNDCFARSISQIERSSITFQISIYLKFLFQQTLANDCIQAIQIFSKNDYIILLTLISNLRQHFLRTKTKFEGNHDVDLHI